MSNRNPQTESTEQPIKKARANIKYTTDTTDTTTTTENRHNMNREGKPTNHRHTKPINISYHPYIRRTTDKETETTETKTKATSKNKGSPRRRSKR